MIPNVRADVRRKNLAIGKRKASYFWLGARCVEMTIKSPFIREDAV